MCLLTITVHNAANPKTPPSPLSCSWPLSPWCRKSSPRAKSSAKYKFSLSSWQLGWLCEEALRHTTWEVVHLLFLEFWVSQLWQTLHHFYTSYTHTHKGSPYQKPTAWSGVDDYNIYVFKKWLGFFLFWRNQSLLELLCLWSSHSPSPPSGNWTSALFQKGFILFIRLWTTNN